MNLTRRGFLQALGIGAAAVVVPELVLEPRRRFWQVPRNAPVSDRSRSNMPHDAAFAPSPMEFWEAWRNRALERVRVGGDLSIGELLPAEQPWRATESAAGRIETVERLHKLGLVTAKDAELVITAIDRKRGTITMNSAATIATNADALFAPGYRMQVII